MAVIKIINFGGVLPAVSERALPAENAVQAEGLLASTPEFRPLLEEVEYAGVLSESSPGTIYRMARTDTGAPNTDPEEGWLAYTSYTNLVRWPQNDADTERTSVTDGEGGYPPRVIDNEGEDRLLGVPPPAKPVVTLNAGDYYTEQERENDIANLKFGIVDSIRLALTPAKMGATYTDDALPGFLETGAETGAPLNLTRYRVHRYDGFEGAITDSYTSASEADVAWLRVTGLGQWLEATGTPAWMGTAGTWHYALPYTAYGAGFQLDSAAVTTALGSFTYLEANQVTEIVDRAEALFNPAAPGAAAVLQPLAQAVAEFERVMDTRPPGSLSEAESATTIDDALEACAQQIGALVGSYGSIYALGAGGGE